MRYEQSYEMLEHHLSREARERLPNPMKTIWKMAHGRRDLISLANGDPHYSLYPISQMDFKVPTISAEDPVSSWTSGANVEFQTLYTSRDTPCALSLKTAFQYGSGSGQIEVRQLLEKMNELVHAPKQNSVILTLGNSDGLAKCFRLLGDPGDNFLAEEFSFPGVTNAPLAQGIKWVPVRMDSEGILPDAMHNILQNWDETVQGRRPRVLYTIPSGQNPTGGTLSLARRREIYRISCLFDIIILEDDPYYFLQYDRKVEVVSSSGNADFAKRFVKGYPETFLSLDVQGRVIRVDSFSKIIVPGLRLGWITCNPLFAEKLEILTDSSTSHPHGLGQVFIAELLSEKGWGFDGYFRWISSLCDDYRRRRDLFLNVFRTEMAGSPFASTKTPSAGMFIWIEIHYEHHPRIQSILHDKHEPGRPKHTNVEALNDELFQALFDAGVVVMPAKMFAIIGNPNNDPQEKPAQDRLNFFRATFAGTDESISNGMSIFCRVVKGFFQASVA